MLTDERVAEIERRILAGESLRTVAAREAVAVSTVQRIAAGRRPRRGRETHELRRRAVRRSPGRPSHAAATIYCDGCRQRVVPVDGQCHLCRVRREKYGPAG